MSTSVSPVMLLRLTATVVLVIFGSALLRVGKLTSRARAVFSIGGVLALGFGLNLLGGRGLDPNPVSALRTVLRTALAGRGPASPVVAPVLVGLMLVAGGVSNKVVCGWACQMGLLQDFIHSAGAIGRTGVAGHAGAIGRTGVPGHAGAWAQAEARGPAPVLRARVPFRISNSVRVLAFAALVGGLASAGFDWIGPVDPFRVFRLDFAPGVAALVLAVLAASVFFYRPWCRFLCPFGLLSWLVEQASILRPRIKRELCLGCERCIDACPTGAMKDFYSGARIHSDCYACGSCLSACPADGAIGWRTAREAQSLAVEG